MATVDVEDKADAKTEGAEPKKPAKARIVVVGTADFASNQFLGAQGNRDFFLNVVSWLAEEEDLISMRPKDTQAESHRLDLGAVQPRAVAAAGRAARRRRDLRNHGDGAPPPHQLALGLSVTWKTIVVLLVLALGLGAFFYYDTYWLMPAREKAESVKGRLWTVEPKDVEARHASSGASDTIRLKRVEGGWEMLEPVAGAR